ncbi:MAG: M1 family metallopeptidase [Flavobacteriales bacterium]|nr:M1 family metallopeptidase [Flavobacteriales bacterium]
MPFRHFPSACLSLFLLSACGGAGDHSESGAEGTTTSALTMDTHSAARPNEAVIQHLDLDIKVDMEAQRIEGSATYALKPGHGPLVRFDTDGLTLHDVKDAKGNALTYRLGTAGPLGAALEVDLPENTDSLTIQYTTGPAARALQWLQPRQTAGGTKPFLFTQGQAILTRSWIPIQDSPGIRFTYDARVQVPPDLMALMSASNTQERSPDGRYSFHMEQPIPAYLMALAVGDLAFRSVGPRTGVYAEPGMVDTAAWELADMERMVQAAEDLYGPYRWERYDVLVLPPSFPFGGMENPRLTFATPTILAGDRSLTALIAHELAHSWSGNLVTNATWNDFWLNEGFTVYFEKRICERIYGKDYANMLATLGHQDLQHTVEKFTGEGLAADTRLKLDLTGRDPDDGVSDVAYEKGYAFLRRLEESVGRERFDAFLRNYFDRFAFQSLNTEQFLDHLQEHLIEPANVQVDVKAWVYGTGIPADLVVPVSDKFTKVEVEVERWRLGTIAAELRTEGWSTFEWIHFVRHLPDSMTTPQMADLDAAFRFTGTGNSEILAVWLERSVQNDYAPAYERLSAFLTSVGRRKFLQPLYEALIKTEKGRAMAQHIYANARPNYHSVAVRTIDELLDWTKMSDPVTL